MDRKKYRIRRKYRIKLLIDLPIEARHAATKGKVYEAEYQAGRYWFAAGSGMTCAAWPREVEVLPDDNCKGEPCE